MPEELGLYVSLGEDFYIYLGMFSDKSVKGAASLRGWLCRTDENPPTQSGASLQSLLQRALDLFNLTLAAPSGEELELEYYARAVKGSYIGIDVFVATASVYSMKTDELLFQQEVAKVLPAIIVEGSKAFVILKARQSAETPLAQLLQTQILEQFTFCDKRLPLSEQYRIILEPLELQANAQLT